MAEQFLKDKFNIGQHGIRASKEEAEKVRGYLQHLSKSNQIDFSSVREFFYFLLDNAINNGANPDLSKEITSLRNKISEKDLEILALKQQLSDKDNEITFLKSDEGRTKAGSESSLEWNVAALKNEIFKDPRLESIGHYIKPEHKHPFDTIEHYSREIESRLLTLYADPMWHLNEDEYQKFKSWINDEMMPALRELTSLPDLQLTGRQKFLLIWDYAQADPVENIILKLTRSGLSFNHEQLIMINNEQFPRAECMEKILSEINSKNQNQKSEINEPVEISQTKTGSESEKNGGANDHTPGNETGAGSGADDEIRITALSSFGAIQ